MSEDWFEDELPRLVPPQLPYPGERSKPAPVPPGPTRRARAATAPVPPSTFAPNRVPAWVSAGAAPTGPSSRQRGYGELIVLRWAGGLLVLLAVLTAVALIVRDARSVPAATPAPTAQLVIPADVEPAPESGEAALAANPAFQGKVICIDPAHGGIDRGFQRLGDANAPAMDEALYTAAYARELAARLTEMGFTVVTTRDGDTVRNLDYQDINRDGQTRETGSSDAESDHNALLDEMQARVDYCNDENADLLISLHFDGSQDVSRSGTTVWYAEGRPDSSDSQRLAQLVSQQLAAGFAQVGAAVAVAGAQPESLSAVQGDQMVYDSLFMITGARDGLKDRSEMPGVVADLLTISNAADARVISSDAGRGVIVRSLAEAVGQYFAQTGAKG